MRIRSRAKRRRNWIGCFNAIKAEASVRNTTVRLSKGSQMHWSDRRSRAVYSTRGQDVCIYDPKDNKAGIYPCAWTRAEMLWK